MSKKNTLDQYYTCKDVADICWEKVEAIIDVNETCFVEPSCGEGVFLRDDVEILGYDLDPKHPEGVKKDFLTVTGLEGKFLIGNPPFGFASSLALKFIKHATKQGCQGFAFILPNTFKKPLFKLKIDLYYDMVEEFDIPKNSFLLDGVAYDVPCTFQVWVKSESKRKVPEIKKHLVKGSEDDHDFILRRVGGRSGRIINKEDYTASSSLYVKGDPQIITINQSSIDEVASYTAGVKSITLNEINLIETQRKEKEVLC